MPGGWCQELRSRHVPLARVHFLTCTGCRQQVGGLERMQMRKPECRLPVHRALKSAFQLVDACGWQRHSATHYYTQCARPRLLASRPDVLRVCSA